MVHTRSDVVSAGPAARRAVRAGLIAVVCAGALAAAGCANRKEPPAGDEPGKATPAEPGEAAPDGDRAGGDGTQGEARGGDGEAPGRVPALIPPPETEATRRPQDGDPPPQVPPSARARLEYERSTIAVFRQVAPSTVFVTQNRVVRDRWSRRALEVPAGTGSGFVWDDAGHIVTNFHVIAEGRSWTVTLYNGETLTAELVGGDRNKDIAVLRIDTGDAGKEELVPVVLPPEGSVIDVGQAALAIGNPFGFDHTLTTGVVSAIGREVKGYGGVTIRDMIQTDASINPGNSGGPLLDSAGELVGMNTMIYSQSGSSAGIGFAVPVSTLRRVVPQIIQFGKPRRAGLRVELVPDPIAQRNGIRGVVIERVDPDGPAAAAGLRGLVRTRRGPAVGDVIVGIDDHEVNDYDTLYNALDRYKPGDTVAVKVARDGKVVQVQVTLAEIE